ncbi:hypothetical protein DEAC_c41870 [Desulfosporosinus acididurans]|uniref:Uncharacterized protein n=1 Tax=Desulfosporosinus acididurans TaxID=476652 RepID=A0A0J1FK86_9FIRM|nr:hypothetical protein [Desulfosporosinus acididurans]KLU63875.1 hypothetical protein DEAC_c41870 [Desulfosporosinus acididurans]
MITKLKVLNNDNQVIEYAVENAEGKGIKKIEYAVDDINFGYFIENEVGELISVYYVVTYPVIVVEYKVNYMQRPEYVEHPDWRVDYYESYREINIPKLDIRYTVGGCINGNRIDNIRRSIDQYLLENYECFDRYGNTLAIIEIGNMNDVELKEFDKNMWGLYKY